MTDNPNLTQFLDRLEKLSDETRTEAKNKRHKLGLRTARENLDHLVDNKSFLETKVTFLFNGFFTFEYNHL